MSRHLSIVLFLFQLLPTPDVSGQESYDRESRYWLTLGLGTTHFGPGLYGSASTVVGGILGCFAALTGR